MACIDCAVYGFAGGLAEHMQDYQQIFDARGHLYNDAMSVSPGAREQERATLLAAVTFQPGQQVMDTPAGGGFVADGVQALTGGSVKLICVEPSHKFSAPVADRYPLLTCPLHMVPLPDASVDVILSLAGLHHMAGRAPVYAEWARLLRPGGQLAVADVAADTGTAHFLNGFVDQHTPGGHEGLFIGVDEFSQGLAAAGLEVIYDRLEDVPWHFPDRTALGTFCHRLFGTEKARPAAVATALEHTVGTSVLPDGRLALRWQLRYAVARRPR